MLCINRKFNISTGHRILSGDKNNKCKTPHGHNYEITLGLTIPDNYYIDATIIKQIFGTWLEKQWDHTFIFDIEDYVMINIWEQIHGIKKAFILPYPPTVENLAKYLALEVVPILFKDHDIILNYVKVQETKNIFAIFKK